MQHASVQAEAPEFVRLPGLFRRWELERVIDEGTFHIERAGRTSDGAVLFAVYRREAAPQPNQER